MLLGLSGGEGGIRTLGTVQHRTLAFQASPFNHSGTSPDSGVLIRGRAAILGDVVSFGNVVRCLSRPALAEYRVIREAINK